MTFLAEWRSSVNAFSKIITAEFQVTSIHSTPEPGSAPGQSQLLETVVRFELVGAGQGFLPGAACGQLANVLGDFLPRRT